MLGDSWVHRSPFQMISKHKDQQSLNRVDLIWSTETQWPTLETFDCNFITLVKGSLSLSNTPLGIFHSPIKYPVRDDTESNLQISCAFD